MSKKKPHTPLWMCRNPTSRFTRIYSDMVTSAAFLALTHKQQLLLFFMLFQFNPSTKAVHPDGNPNRFYFNRLIYREKLKLYNNDSRFYRDRDALIEKGFIKQTESGYTTRRKSVYEFSSRWKSYDPEKPFSLSNTERTVSMANKTRLTDKNSKTTQTDDRPMTDR